MSQYWKENSIAIDSGDSIIWLEASPANWDERIILKITDHVKTNTRSDTKQFFRAALTLSEAISLRKMLDSVIDHHREMDDAEKYK